jgi:hypothetical protein
MKRNLIILLAAMFLTSALILGLGLSAHAQPATPERHPAIRRAIASLQEARVYLKNANHDFGGHRAEALVQVDKALEQLKLALKYDKN